MLRIVERFIESTIATDQPMRRLGWIDPNDVVIDVFIAFTRVSEGFARVIGYFHVGIHAKQAIGVGGIHKNLLVVVAGGEERILLRPAFAVIVADKNAALAFFGFYHGIHLTGFGGCGDGDSAEFATG